MLLQLINRFQQHRCIGSLHRRQQRIHRDNMLFQVLLGFQFPQSEYLEMKYKQFILWWPTLSRQKNQLNEELLSSFSSPIRSAFAQLMLRENTLQQGFGNRAIGVVAHDYKR